MKKIEAYRVMGRWNDAQIVMSDQLITLAKKHDDYM